MNVAAVFSLKFIQVLTGFLLILVSGVFWGTWFALSRSISSFPPETFILIGKRIIENVALPMSIIMPASVIGLLILTIASWKTKSVYFYSLLAAVLLLMVTFMITVAVEVPIDNQIKTWTKETIPSGWESIRDRWQRHHTFRTFTGLGSVLFFIVALINRDH